mmetsp:Transcript_26436/g.26830  ORF Transcript_26436/g.26830 Transcript_26436/m.26830 type:complete len:154 (-) Transcript_26436:352-813(-)
MNEANEGVYEANNYYQNSLPYASESIIGNECVSCLEVDDNDDNNNGDVEITELCQEMYEASGKCETYVSNLYYPSVGACDYINNILPQISKVYSGTSSSVVSSISSAASGDTATLLSFVFGVSTVGLALYSCFLYKKASDAGRSIGLSQQGIV